MRKDKDGQITLFDRAYIKLIRKEKSIRPRQNEQN